MLFLLVVACGGRVTQTDFGAREGEACEETLDCTFGLVCASDLTCQPEGVPGTYQGGQECIHADECAVGLVCDSDGRCAEPGESGALEEGASCDVDDDCQLGMECLDGVCTDLGVPYWTGVECAPRESDVRAYFEVPTLPTTQDLEFYRLPFPNDVRLLDGELDLSGHPSPGGDVDTWLADMEASVDGYDLNPTVFFRFSGRLDVGTVQGLTGSNDTVFFANVDPRSDNYGMRSSFTWRASQGRNRYLCQDWVAVSTFAGAQLEPDTTYAVWLGKGITDQDGEPVTADAHLGRVLGDDRPADDFTLGRAWDVYGPLRDYLTDANISVESVLTAAVFTTGDPAALGGRFEAALAQTELELGTPTTCGAGSACGRNCAGDVDETHLLLTVPLYQQGERPFTADGQIEYDNLTGAPKSVGTEDVCVVWTQPDGGADDLVVVVQDRGADLQDFITDGTAQALADQGLAAVAIEATLHGARGDAPDALVSWDNPAARTGGSLQASSDLFALLQALEGAVPGQVFWLAHGWGAQVSLPVLAHTRIPENVVLGGVSGHPAVAWIDAEDPDPVRHAVMQLAHDERVVERWHPLLTLLQLDLSTTDPSSFAGPLWKDPRGGADGVNVLHYYGIDDPIASAAGQQAFQLAADVPTVGTAQVDFDQDVDALPASRNALDSRGDRRTTGSIQVADRAGLFEAAELVRIGGFYLSSLDADQPTIE